MEKNYRIDKNLIKKIKFPIILISFCYLLGIIVYNKLPFFVPTSWDYLTIGNFFPRIKRNWFIGVGSFSFNRLGIYNFNFKLFIFYFYFFEI